MKKFWINFLVIIIYAIGIQTYFWYAKLDGFHWYHLLLLALQSIIGLPACIWYGNYFRKLFA